MLLDSDKNHAWEYANLDNDGLVLIVWTDFLEQALMKGPYELYSIVFFQS